MRVAGYRRDGAVDADPRAGHPLGDRSSRGGRGTRIDCPFAGGLAWLLRVVAAGVMAFLLAGSLVQAGRVLGPGQAVSATAVATLLLLVRMAVGPGADQRIGNPDVTLGRGAGMLIALLAAIAALVGALLNLRAEGDSIKAIFASLSKPGDHGAARQADEAGPLPPPTGEVTRQPPPVTRAANLHERPTQLAVAHEPAQLGRGPYANHRRNWAAEPDRSGSAPLRALQLLDQAGHQLAGLCGSGRRARSRRDLARDWGLRVQQNLVHGSDWAESAAREVALWFP